MLLLTSFERNLKAIRNFLWPEYLPERHYMRGPGPACARKTPSVH